MSGGMIARCGACGRLLIYGQDCTCRATETDAARMARLDEIEREIDDLGPTPGKVLGPSVRWINPLRISTWRDADGWTAKYAWGGRSARQEYAVSGCDSKREAIRALRRGLKMRVAWIDGRFMEVP